MRCATSPPTCLRRAAPLVVAITAVFSLTGCLTFETLIRVQRDGSGTVTMYVALSGPMLEMLTSLMGDANLCDEDDLREQATQMGEGVQLTSAEPMNEDGVSGCKAVYSFADINTLRINQNPGDQMPAEMASEEQSPPEEEEYVQFRFTPGDPALLVVQLPHQEISPSETTEETPPPTDEAQREMQMAMMREMFEHTRIQMAVEVAGAITTTNATYRDGNRLTLVDMDFDILLENEEDLERLAGANPKSTTEVKALLEGIEGIKIEMNEEVQVTFE